MRLRKFINSIFHRGTDSQSRTPATSGRRARMRVWVWRVQDIAPRLNEKHPFFEMMGGGTYGVELRGGKPAGFVRVDKDKRPRKERKRQRQIARMATGG